MKKTLFTLLLSIVSIITVSSQIEISGVITDDTGTPLPDVNIIVKGTTKGTVTDFDGLYQISLEDSSVLSYSYIGYVTQEFTVSSSQTIDITLQSDLNNFDEIVLVGSRNPKRTIADSPVAVDIIDLKDVITKTGKVEITELLQFTAPSFNAQKQSGADGADHITPATLRGLGPDQTLVLINGKRRHQSSLINLFGTRGRGNTGTDLNAIPASAIERIEVLRDGASAQYGSDAIAGVINIVMKKSTEQFTGEVFYGANDADSQSYGLPARNGLDGNTYKATGNYGVSIGDKGGFINVTGEYLNKEKTFRPGASFRSKFGEAGLTQFQTFLNAEIPFNEDAIFYAFGGTSLKDTDAFAFDRGAIDERNVLTLNPNGFTPRITSIINDRSISAGIRSKYKGWDVDFNNTYGLNEFHYFIKGTLNATLLEASPTEFDAGGHTLSQNTTGLTFTKQFDVLEGLNLAFGGEYRIENFTIFAGEEGSYEQFDANGQPITSTTLESDVLTFNGNVRPGGSQGFPGYSPENEVDQTRTNIGFFADAELDVSETLLMTAAIRAENYSDFGSTFTGKLSTRVKIIDGLNFRASGSTGFRAPSLAQLFFNLRFSDFEGGELQETLLASNVSPVAKALKIPSLKEEKAISAGAGFSYSANGFTFSVDGYYTAVNDRIVLTGTFDETSGLDPALRVDAARAFINGVDTETYGIDLVASYTHRINEHKLSGTLVGNLNKVEIRNINNGDLDEDTFFGENEQAFLRFSAPEYKIGLGLDYSYEKLNVNVNNTLFGDVGPFISNDDGVSLNQYDPKLTTDISVGYQLLDEIKLIVGANNFFNVYPDEQNPNGTESFGLYDAVQQGFGGAFYYTRISYNF